MKLLLDFIARRWIPISAVLLIAITALSLWPLEKLPEVPGGDKLHHAIAYAALMFPAALARPKHLWAIFLFYLAWSGGIELIQPYVNRYGEWMDFAANALGLIATIILRFTFNLI
ncbi:VanZ family protein [Candidatus Parcubacteria bacterium]|nr:MAG: VanZ family protein [Candidatus Parcubacteria bacterium]